MVDEDGGLVAKREGGLPFLLHSDPPCPPFSALAWRDVFGYLRTGEAVSSAPIVPRDPKPEKPRKATHR